MVWGQIAMGAANALTGYSQKSSQMKVAKAQLELERGRANNKVQLQAANNLLQAAQAEQQRSEQQRHNRKVMENMEKGLEQSAFNLGKQVDGLNTSRFSSRLKGAAALGTLAATAGAAGVGGASVEALASNEQLRMDLADKAMADQIQDAQYVASLNNSALVDNAYSQLDNSYVFSNFDYSAKDMVLDTTSQYKWGLMDGVTDFGGGFSGNMGKVGINLGEYGYKGDSNLFTASVNGFNSLSKGITKMFGGNAGATTRL